MKKILTTVLFLCIATVAFAQATFGITAGPNFSNTTYKTGDAKATTHIIVGIAGGVFANLPLLPDLYLQPALLYEGRGGSEQVSGYRQNTRLNYLSLPVDLLFKPEMTGGDGRWLIGIGPYFAYGFSAKKSGKEIQSFDSFKEGFLRRFDGGVDVQLGAEFTNRLSLAAKADIGVVNVSNLGKAFFTRNTSFGLMLGYTFGKD